LEQKVSGLREENKKLKQLVATNNDEIAALKKSCDETIARLAMGSRKLKEEQEKAF
jgi:predicted RNase H-like nuclease (RuvC/YqgF family)